MCDSGCLTRIRREFDARRGKNLLEFVALFGIKFACTPPPLSMPPNICRCADGISVDSAVSGLLFCVSRYIDLHVVVLLLYVYGWKLGARSRVSISVVPIS